MLAAQEFVLPGVALEAGPGFVHALPLVTCDKHVRVLVALRSSEIAWTLSELGIPWLIKSPVAGDLNIFVGS